MNHTPISKRVKYPKNQLVAIYICLEEALYGTGPLYLAKKHIDIQIARIPKSKEFLYHLYNAAKEAIDK